MAKKPISTGEKPELLGPPFTVALDRLTLSEDI